MLVRAKGLAESMSRYLIRRIEESPHITLHTQTEIVALEGDGQPRARDLAQQPRRRRGSRAPSATCSS